nr:ribonuclease H-like domain-containing protein [Tanacetum cinerariifolium]
MLKVSKSCLFLQIKSRFRIDSESLNKVYVLVVLDLSKVANLLYSLRVKDLLKSKDPQVVSEPVDGVIQVIAPTTAKQRLAKKNKLKPRGTLLMALPDKHQLKFNIHNDAKSLMEAIKKSQLEILGESISQEDINLKFLRSLPSKWKTHTLIWRNKADLEEQSLDDLFNNLKIYEAEVKGSSTSSHNTQNIAFVSLNNTDNTNKSVNTVPSATAASFQAPVSTLLNVDSLSDAVIYSFFAKEMDLKWQMAMLTMRARRFLQTNGRNLGTNETTAIGFDMSKFECYNCHRRDHFTRDCRSPRDNRNKDTPRRTVLVEVSTSNALVSQYDAVGSHDWSFQADKEPTNYAHMAYAFSGSSSSLRSDNESDDSVLVNDKYKLSEGYHAVPPPYTGTFMHPKPNLVFNDASNSSMTVLNVVHVESSSNKPSKDMSKILRPDAPIIEDWTSDSKDEYEIECVPKQKEPSFVPTSKHVKTPRASVGQNVVPTTVLTRSGLVSFNAARPVSTDVPQTNMKSLRSVKHVVHKAHSPIRRLINHRPATKTSNFNQKVTTVKVNKVNVVQGTKGNWTLSFLFDVHGNPQQALKDKGVIDSGCSRHMTRNISYLSDFEEFNRGYVAFGGNPKGRQRVPRENNMYNVDLKNVVPLGDLTCLFEKATLDESNLWHRRLGHINFKTMNKLLKGNLVRGLPSKLFENNHTCVACKKVKQHRASCKSKPVSFVSHPLQRIPQQNRVAERKNRTLIEAARTMLADSLLPIPFWTELVNTACYVQNKVLVTKPHNKTPYALLIGRPHSIGFMRPFGCLVTILNTLDPLGKFDGKADEGFLVGYFVNSKAFRAFNRSGPKWLFDIDTLTQSMNYQPVVVGNQPNHNAGIQENFDAGKVRKETIYAQQYALLPLWSTGSKDPQNIDDAAAFDAKEYENEVYVSPSSSNKPKKHDEKAKRADKGKSCWVKFCY